MNNKSKPSFASKRIDWIDCAKGIAILTTIVGHSVGQGRSGSMVRGLVFSFHMPLFFILSSATYKCSTNIVEFKNKTLKAMKHLLKPAMITYIIIIAHQCIIDHNLLLNLVYWKGKLYTLLFASGVNTSFCNFEVACIGVPWFFFALFIGRTIFDLLHLKFDDEVTLSIMCCMVGMIGIAFGKFEYLPLSIDISLAIMPFFMFGNLLKKTQCFRYPPVKSMMIFFLIWICTLCISFPDHNNWSYLELAARRYPLFPLCYITAIAGTMFIATLSTVLCRFKKLATPLLYVGKNSMYLLCVHILDGMWWQFWYIDGYQFQTALKRTIVNLLIFIAFMLFKNAISYLLVRTIK